MRFAGKCWRWERSTCAIWVSFWLTFCQTKKTARLSYRRVYPPELVRYLDIPDGKTQAPTELKRSLQARKLSDLGTLEKWREANAEWEANVAVARKRYLAAYDALSPERAGQLATAFKYDWQLTDMKLLEERGDDYVNPVRNYWDEKLSHYVRWHGDAANRRDCR